ncbi:MAG: hypothetical protein A3F89_03030 [Deltaproteobacteria bacterium RIFCSPLOWO2_12_FULL_50_11]|nr:MAG: hypothetical protein A3F89_03030 [Deltaproteobacteria bacterium RIFCSPLOWO2_12_FULL_50_11]
MGRFSGKTQQLFKKWGQSGGRARAKKLSSRELSLIAARAARTRWGVSLPSIRMENSQMDDPVYIEEILSDGLWKDWQNLYQIIADHPFGDTAAAVEKVCDHANIYGATALWKGILYSLRGAFYETAKGQGQKTS